MFCTICMSDLHKSQRQDPTRNPILASNMDIRYYMISSSKLTWDSGSSYWTKNALLFGMVKSWVTTTTARIGCMPDKDHFICHAMLVALDIQAAGGCIILPAWLWFILPLSSSGWMLKTTSWSFRDNDLNLNKMWDIIQWGIEHLSRRMCSGRILEWCWYMVVNWVDVQSICVWSGLGMINKPNDRVMIKYYFFGKNESWRLWEDLF